jgi:TP901 family phage tail tape measure protein
MAINASRRAQIELGLDPKGLDSGIADARAKLRGFEDAVRRDQKRRKSKGAGAIIGGAVGGFTASATSRAMDYASEVAGEVIGLERSLTRLQIATGRTPREMEGFRAKLSEVSKESGIARTALLEGTSAYVALTGDAAGAEAALATFARVANASGATMEDIATTGAALKDNLGIDPKDFETGFGVLIEQGKAGAIELKELATLLSGLAPSFAQFKGGKGLGGMADLGAAFQASRKGFGSAAEAATGVRSLMVAINRSASKFEKAGVKIFTKNPKTGKKELRGFLEIVDAIGRSKLAKDGTLLTKAFGSDEAKRAYDQLILNRNLVRDLAAAGADGATVGRDAAAFQESAAGRLAAAMNNLKESVAAALSPERIEAFASVLERAVRLAGDLAIRIEKVIDAVPGMRREFRRLFDIQTDDDLIEDRRNAHLQSRFDEAKRRGLHPAQIAAEDRLANALETGVKPDAPGVKNAGQRFSLAELQHIRDIIAPSATDADRLQNLASQAIVRELIEQIKKTPTIVQLGTESVNRASQDAKTHRGRPGGR